MNIRLDRTGLLLLFDAWWLTFLALEIFQANPFYLLTIIGFLSLSLLPGLLTLFALRVSGIGFFAYLLFACGLSILEILVLALIGNTLGPVLGVARPLDGRILIDEMSLFVSSLAVYVWLRRKTVEWRAQLSFSRVDIRMTLLALAPIVFVAMAIGGALSLNSGGGNMLILAMLPLIACYFALLIYVSGTRYEAAIPTALFFISLALLFMTSLRGWGIVGHDIQREYAVFQLTDASGLWSIALLKDAYNACMSITILPTVFFNLLAIPAPYVYKVLFQILFALVPSTLYLFARRYAGPGIALVSSLYFVAFPTFFTDMPFLNRQEIAFLFLALMFLALGEERLRTTMRHTLFLVFGIGMILSHYSTTYTVVALLIFVVCTRPILIRTKKYFPRSLLLRSSVAFTPSVRAQEASIKVSIVVILAGASFLWSSILTDTSSNSLYRVVAETFAVMQSNVHEDSQSSDVLYSLFASAQQSPQERLTHYQNATVPQMRSEIPQNQLYSDAVLAPYANLSVAPGDVLPITALGRVLERMGIDVSAFHTIVRQLSARLLQLFIVIGIVVALCSRRFAQRLFDLDVALMSAGSMLLILAIVVLPILSAEYGLLRAFQQSLIFLGLFATIGTLALVPARWRVAMPLASALALVFFLSTTGVFTQITGGYDPQLHLNNAGSYYDLLYVTPSETAAIQWLGTQVQSDLAKGKMPVVQSDNSAVNAALALQSAELPRTIVPALIQKDAYVFLTPTNTEKHKATINYNSDLISYLYPIAFLDKNKTLVYNAGGVRIYK